MKRIFTFIGLLLPWFFNTLLPINYNYYNIVNLPFFAPKPIFYSISWSIIYILIVLSIMCILYSYSLKSLSWTYKVSLIINYFFNQIYTLIFFNLKNNFLSFIVCIIVFISLLFFINETYFYKKKCVLYLIPYILLSLFAVILSYSIYIINL